MGSDENQDAWDGRVRHFETRLNEPYSGMGGMMYSAHRHARAARTRSLELEIRQDLSGDPTQVKRLSQVIAMALAAIQEV